MSKNLPGKRPFYKYVTQETTLAMLQNQTFRVRTPLDFNDPFDVQSGLHFDFDLTTLQDKVLNRIEELASSPVEPVVDAEDVWGKIVLMARRYYPSKGFQKESWRNISEKSFEIMVAVLKNTQLEYREYWNANLPKMRVFCVTENQDNLLMWAHYAEDHKGAVLELWSLPEEDNPLSVAEKVQYIQAPPPFFTVAEWIDDLVGIKKIDFNALYKKYAYLKSDHWAYEKEWRFWYPLTNVIERYEDLPIRQSEFKAIYIGCCASPTFIQNVLIAARTNFPNVKVYRAYKAEKEYSLQYKELQHSA